MKFLLIKITKSNSNAGVLNKEKTFNSKNFPGEPNDKQFCLPGIKLKQPERQTWFIIYFTLLKFNLESIYRNTVLNPIQLCCWFSFRNFTIRS